MMPGNIPLGFAKELTKDLECILWRHSFSRDEELKIWKHKKDLVCTDYKATIRDVIWDQSKLDNQIQDVT